MSERRELEALERDDRRILHKLDQLLENDQEILFLLRQQKRKLVLTLGTPEPQ